MHLIITDAWLAKSRAIYLSGTKLVIAGFVAALVLMLVAAGLYHWVFLKGAREGWPVIGSLVKLVVKDESDQRDRFMRENLDVMAKRLGEMQAKMIQLEALGERVSGLAGINPGDIKSTMGSGGVLIEGRSLTMDELQLTLAQLDKLTDQRVDLMTVMESRLFDQKIKKMMVPTQRPVTNGILGSPFGWRIDPLNGRSALHTGLDFPSEPGTPILAAAGGVVVTQEFHPAYGNMVEIDHGNDLMTVMESRLFDQKIKKMMVPTQRPVTNGILGSPFGWRIDPLNGRSALHTGLDFPSEPGTSILAAAGGVVVTQEFHPAYGNMVEIDHGNDLITRYAHSSRVFVKKGDLVKRGQKIAEVGTTGRSTGPHLHFEVLVQGVFQDPQKFLMAGQDLPNQQLAAAGTPGSGKGPAAAVALRPETAPGHR